MKLAHSVLMFLTLLWPIGTSYGSEGCGFGTYPLPVFETEVLLTKWLQLKKYSVSSNVLSNGEIVLQGTTSGKSIKISIRPHSPLATEIDLMDTAGIVDMAEVSSSWESFLARTEKPEKSERAATIPERVRSLTDAVVCINSPPADEKKINFTGFLIDRKGTIITIAHDLEKLRDFKLNFSGGVVTKGLVLKSDTTKDISVIKSDHKGNSNFFSLKEGKSKLHLGERIYMLCCSSTGEIQVQSGMVDKPKATVNAQTLLQVKLENVFLGSSGSPVVDENGRLVGVVKGRFRGTDTRGFLILLDTVRSLVGMGIK